MEVNCSRLGDLRSTARQDCQEIDARSESSRNPSYKNGGNGDDNEIDNMAVCRLLKTRRQDCRSTFNHNAVDPILFHHTCIASHNKSIRSASSSRQQKFEPYAEHLEDRRGCGRHLQM